MTVTHQFLPIKTLDNIPPLCLSFLTEFGPLIKYIADFIDILEWRDTGKSTFTLLLWITICLWTSTYLIFGLPLLFLIRTLLYWLDIQITRRKRQEKEKLIYKKLDDEKKLQFEKDVSRGTLAQSNSISSIDQTLADLNHIQSWWYRKRSSIFFCKSPEDYNWISLTSTMIYVFPTWALFNKLVGTRLVLMLMGSLLLAENSTGFKIAVMAFKRNTILCSVVYGLWSYNVAIISYITGLSFRLKSIQDTSEQEKICPKSSLLSCHETYRCEIPVIVEIYENQRWWLGLDWTTNLLQSERAPWTDNQLQVIESKDAYTLPKEKFTVKTTCEKGVVIKRTTIKSWVWIDRDWWIDMTGELESKVDLNGWQYGNNCWEHLSPEPSPHTFTRQRRWCRRARLIERQVSEHEKQD